MKRLLLVGLILILTACGVPEVSTPAPTPEAINIIYPQALQAWADNLVSCASNHPQIALYFMESDVLVKNILPSNIVLEFGNPDNTSEVTYQSQVGWEQVVVLVNKENPLTQLSIDELKSIFSGQVVELENGSGRSTQVWVLPEGEPTRMIFDQVVMQNQSLTTDSMLVPDPSAMLEALSQNIDAIGYIPRSYLNTNNPSYSNKVKIVQLEPSIDALLRQPVIALTQGEPKGLLRYLLVCLEGKTP
jgi:hypothetical protein